MQDSIKHILYKTLLYPVPDKYRYMASHRRMHRRFGDHQYLLNLNDPKTFNEKICWLKIHHRFEEGQIIADKYLVRDYVSGKIGEEYLIPLIDVFENTNDINYSRLPDQFVLKPNHGSGWVIICTDKANADTDTYNRKLNKWLNLDFYFLSGEWQYRGLDKKILCEELIQELENIVDYKFYCFNGTPRIIQVDFDRHTKHTRTFYDLDWNKLDISFRYPPGEKDLPEPIGLAEMREVAAILGKEFTFCRVDLYDVKGKIYFGEITLHPEAGNGPFKTYNQDLKMGEMLDISHLQKKYGE